MSTRAWWIPMLLVAVGCAHSDGSSPDLGKRAVTTPDDGGLAIDGPIEEDTTLLGVWSTRGTDSLGAYAGQIELRDAGDGTWTFARVVKYDTATVEDSRELWWVWTGTATAGTTSTVSIALLKADFVASRGGITRTDADKVPLALTGTIALVPGGATAHFAGESLSFDDVLDGRTDNATQPIFATDLTVQAAMATPSSATKTSLFTLYASYQALSNVAPYVMDPAFQAGVCDLYVDKTDFDFYQAHPRALRVIDKVIDAPSLGETLARATAYGPTLVGKAAIFDAETPVKFIDPVTGQLADSVVNGAQVPSYDGALWTSAYVASQAYRYWVTQDAAAITNIEKSVDSIQLLMEIDPDQTAFARTVRPASGNATGGWHAGVGAFAAYDWLEGGNNDMFKGLEYGTLMGYAALCDPVLTGEDARCARLRTNAHHMLADLSITQGGVTDSNHLLAAWLSAYANNSLSDLATTIEAWTTLSTVVAQGDTQMSVLATADWSGTHLNFVEFASFHILSARKPLPGFDTGSSIRQGVETERTGFQRFRMGLWSVFFATLTGTPQQVDIDDARWRLREVSAPKLMLDVDHRVGADFVMSPYPSAPWKNDWTTNDRSSSLHGYPTFATPWDVYGWRLGPFQYQRDTSTEEYSGADYLHAYWIGRWLNLFSATE